MLYDEVALLILEFRPVSPIHLIGRPTITNAVAINELHLHGESKQMRVHVVFCCLEMPHKTCLSSV